MPAIAQIPDGLLQRRLDMAKTAEAAAIKDKELMQKRLCEVDAQLELAKANVGYAVQFQSPITQTTAKVNCGLFPSNT